MSSFTKYLKKILNKNVDPNHYGKLFFLRLLNAEVLVNWTRRLCTYLSHNRLRICLGKNILVWVGDSIKLRLLSASALFTYLIMLDYLGSVGVHVVSCGVA